MSDSHPLDVSSETDFEDDEERRFRARRLFTYTPRAVAVASGVEKVFVNHPQFKASLEGLDRVFQLGRELKLAQGIAVTGVSGTGKTALMQQFRSSLPKSSRYEDGMGAVAVRIPKSPSVGRIISHLLSQIRYPLPQVTASTLTVKRTVLLEALRSYGTRVVLVDEAHNLRGQVRMRSRYDDGTMVTDLLREVMDEVPLALGLFGGPDLADLAGIDQHLASRVSALYALDPFEHGGTWHGFVRAFKRQCSAFDLSFLDTSEQVIHLHRATQGNLRAFKRLVTEAVMVAVDQDCTALQQEHLARAYTRISGDAKSSSNPYGQ